MTRTLNAVSSLLILRDSAYGLGPRPAPLKAPFDGEAAGAAQRKWERFLNVPSTRTDSNGTKLVIVPPGEFMMGMPLATGLEPGPQHAVRITRPFWLSTCEVTLGQFRAFMKSTNYMDRWKSQGSKGDGLLLISGKMLDDTSLREYGPDNWGHPNQTSECPVVNVSWNDAVAYCEWLSSVESCKYRLPTEAEWEYACRAGTTTEFVCGDEVGQLIRFGNFADASLSEQIDNRGDPEVRDGFPLTAPVGSFRPNAFGLYDMHGNVSEWCSDWFAEDYYSRSEIDDPAGPADGEVRLIRGGGWPNWPEWCSSAHRLAFQPDWRLYDVGFRVVREVAQEAER